MNGIHAIVISMCTAALACGASQPAQAPTATSGGAALSKRPATPRQQAMRPLWASSELRTRERAERQASPIRPSFESRTLRDAMRGRSPGRNLGTGLATMVLANCTPKRARRLRRRRPTRDHTRRCTRRLRILCLHGYHGQRRRPPPTDGAVARRTPASSLRTSSTSTPHRLPPGTLAWCARGRRRAGSCERRSGRRRPASPLARRWMARTRAAIVKAFEEQGPFDGVLGFSQGAALAGLLVGLRAPDGVTTAERPIRFEFAIVVSGFGDQRSRARAPPLRSKRLRSMTCRPCTPSGARMASCQTMTRGGSRAAFALPLS